MSHKMKIYIIVSHLSPFYTLQYCIFKWDSWTLNRIEQIDPIFQNSGIHRLKSLLESNQKS